MRKTLEAMYYDNLSISGRRLDKKSEYYKVERAVCETACELEETLTPQQKEIWERYTSLTIKAANLSNCDNFILGFRIGANLLVEALVDCNDDCTFPMEEWRI